MTPNATSADDLSMVRLDATCVADLMALQDVVCRELESPELYFPVTEPEMKEFFETDGLCIGAFHADRLVAYFGVLFMGDRPHNVGLDLGIPEHQLRQVAYFKAVNVLPAYRGLGIQKRLTQALFSAMGVETRVVSGIPAFEWLCSTVSPLNLASLKSFLDSGFWIGGLKPKYQGHMRYLLMRSRARPAGGQGGSIAVPTHDYKTQLSLLEQGKVGVEMTRNSSVSQIHYRGRSDL